MNCSNDSHFVEPGIDRTGPGDDILVVEYHKDWGCPSHLAYSSVLMDRVRIDMSRQLDSSLPANTCKLSILKSLNDAYPSLLADMIRGVMRKSTIST